MEDQWWLLREVRKGEQTGIEASAYVPSDSLWFSGHFPGEPVLPGVALVQMVWQAIVQDAGDKGEIMFLDTLKKVRFTQPVRPGENLSVLVNVDELGEEILYSFKVIRKENVVCSGLLTARRINK